MKYFENPDLNLADGLSELETFGELSELCASFGRHEVLRAIGLVDNVARSLREA